MNALSLFDGMSCGRVALFKYPGVEAVVSVANSEEDAGRYNENGYFVRWLTDWVEYSD